MLFFSQFVRPTQRKLGWPFSFILSCDQHRKLAGLCDVANSEYWRFLSEIIFLWDQQRELACLFGLFDLYYSATNTENWHAFFLFLLLFEQRKILTFLSEFILLCYQHRKLAGLFLEWFLYYCATNTKYWRFFCIWDYIIVRPTQKTGVPFWFWFIVLCDQRTKLACILRVRWNWHVIAWKMIVIFHILSWRPTAIWRFDNAQWQLFLSLPTKQNTDTWAIYNWCVDNVRG